jgi:hypothetical protein
MDKSSMYPEIGSSADVDVWKVKRIFLIHLPDKKLIFTCLLFH